ncbi:uncharacterized protein LOC113550114 [Rhopalosiphum maidis]|uniref:uncharacterized protein LOC113550114 n=1 Tax=Rhopalosiphum maidis TaxID=43146 RepID=UPI000F001650|nr:uncharacterized protein LOC113550114 [Rhopalosiphum maidis]
MSLITKTTVNVWEMEKGFDIILFIDKNDVHNSEYWKNECFRRINAKYLFQKLFRTNIINVTGKSCALVYSVYGESICCLLLNGSKNENSNAKHTYDKNRKKKSSMASDVENELRTIRERLAGYRYLTAQGWARPVAYDFELIFRTVFRGDSGELWLYGQRRPLPSPRERVSSVIGFSCNRNETHCIKDKILEKNNAKNRKSSNKIILPTPRPFIRKLKPVVPTITAPIELLQSDDDCEKPTMQQPNVLVIKIIPQNIWELDSDIDIILFIDTEAMYMDDWKDEVVERVNDHYPFKNRLLKDIQIMPVGAGTVHVYRQNGVSIFCIFFSNNTIILSDWMEIALISIKRMLTGYVQLAIQQDLSLSEFQLNIYSNLYFFFQSVFTYDTVVLWLCGSSV